MRRTWALLGAFCIATMTVPLSAAQLADPEVSVGSSEPVNQTTTVSVVANQDGTTTVTVTTQGEVVNETASVTVPNDAVTIVDQIVSLILGLVSDAFDLVISLCNTIVGLLGNFKCK